jgi:small-conductance mechanosensitive channel
MLLVLSLDRWIPLFIVLGSFLAGLALDAGIRKIALWAERGRPIAAFIFSAFRGVSMLYAVSLGVYIVKVAYPLDGTKGALLEQHVAGTLFIIANTIVFVRLAERLVAGMGRYYGERFPSASLFESIARVVVVCIGFLCLLQSFHVAVAPLITAISVGGGVGGIAIALALRETLANLFAGLQIIAAHHQMSPGDYVKLDGGYEGFIVDITWRNTTIRDLSDNLIVVPNDKIGATIFTNYSVPDQRMTVCVEAPVAFGQDLTETTRIALEVARSVLHDLGADAAGEPYARYQQITENGIVLATYFTIGRFTDRFAARSLYFERFYTRCSQEGVALSRQGFADKALLPHKPE